MLHRIVLRSNWLICCLAALYKVQNGWKNSHVCLRDSRVFHQVHFCLVEHPWASRRYNEERFTSPSITMTLLPTLHHCTIWAEDKWKGNCMRANTWRGKRKHTHTHTRTFTQLEAHTQGQRRGTAEAEAGSGYSLKSSLPHSSHLLHRGDISCSGPNLAPKWRVPRCSNAGVCAVFPVCVCVCGATPAYLRCEQGSMPDTLCSTFFVFCLLKVVISPTDPRVTPCYKQAFFFFFFPRLWSISTGFSSLLSLTGFTRFQPWAATPTALWGFDSKPVASETQESRCNKRTKSTLPAA